MVLTTFKCNYLTPVHFKGLTKVVSSLLSSVTVLITIAFCSFSFCFTMLLSPLAWGHKRHTKPGCSLSC